MGDGVAGTGTVLLPRPRERSTVDSFFPAVRLAVNFVCIASQGQADTGRWIIDFHLLLIGEQLCSLFPGTSFHPHGNKYMHPFNLALVVSTSAINWMFKTTSHFLVRLGKWKATLETDSLNASKFKNRDFFFKERKWIMDDENNMGRCPMQVLQTWGSKDLPAENKAGWDGRLGFLDQIQFPIIWPWFVMLILWASVVSLFCQLPTRKGRKAIAQCSEPHCSALKAFSLTTSVCSVWVVLKNSYISVFARETMLSKSNLGSRWPQSRPLAAQQLFENFWSKTAWWFDFFRIFFFLWGWWQTHSFRTVSCLKLVHFTRNLVIQKHFTIVFR